jgi:hypothetical protein
MADGDMFISGKSDYNLYMLSRTSPDGDEHGSLELDTNEPMY